MASQEVKLNSLFRVQTLLLLKADASMTGYDISKELEKITGKKPSSGKIYPFLHELKNGKYIREIIGGSSEESGRSKTKYELTEKGKDLVEDILERMGNILDSRLEQILEACYHCGVRLFDAEVSRIEDGVALKFCCEHCRSAYETAS